MDHGALLAQGKAGGHGQYEAHDLNNERPLAKVTPYNETAQNRLYFRNTCETESSQRLRRIELSRTTSAHRIKK